MREVVSTVSRCMVQEESPLGQGQPVIEHLNGWAAVGAKACGRLQDPRRQADLQAPALGSSTLLHG